MRGCCPTTRYVRTLFCVIPLLSLLVIGHFHAGEVDMRKLPMILPLPESLSLVRWEVLVKTLAMTHHNTVFLNGDIK